jgi:abnormal spindle-like microcephaly-associated protein
LPIDNDWAEKQCEAFASWLNYLFHPTEDRDHETNHQGDDMAVSDRAALRTLILHRRMAQVRSKASDLFRSPAMQGTLRTIDSEVSRKRLALREDRDMYADLTLRGQITSLLLSYSTPWLRLGLETVFGEIITPEAPTQPSPQQLRILGAAKKPQKVRSV